VWIGTRGVTTPAHYDTSRNLFVQLHGTKRFVLRVPHADNVAMYSHLHPHFRQLRRTACFRNKSKSSSSGSCAGTAATLWEVTLRPGDALFMPAFYIHHVQALEDSISANLWCDSLQSAAIRAVEHAPLPFESTWSDARTQAASLLFLQRVLLQLQLSQVKATAENDDAAADDGMSATTSFVHGMLRARFAAQLKKTTTSSSKDEAGGATDVNASASAFCALVKQQQQRRRQHRDSSDVHFSAEQTDKFDVYAARLVDALSPLLTSSSSSSSASAASAHEDALAKQNEASSSSTDSDEDEDYSNETRLLIVQDYVERLLYWAWAPAAVSPTDIARRCCLLL
jgi:hypothetical protein